MNISQKGIELIAGFEGIRLKAYLDVAGIPTIGIGTIRYPNGKRVKMGDTCTKEDAYFYFRSDLAAFCKAVDDLTTDKINQAQFDALTSLVYNIGQGAYRGSTLRKLVNVNPANPKIRAAFMMWVKAGGKTVKGLQNRRAKEADYYFGLT